MNINIAISDSSESQSIRLLTKVVECLQCEKKELKEKNLSLNSEKNNIVSQLAAQERKCQMLEAEKEKLANDLCAQQGKYETLVIQKKHSESKLTEQEGKCQMLEAEKVKLANDLSAQQGKYEALVDQKKDSENKLAEQERKCQKLEAEKEALKKDLAELKGICQVLKTDKESVESSYDELAKQQTDANTRRLVEAIKNLSQMLQKSLCTHLAPKWEEYLGGIKRDVDRFITEEKTISDITLKIVSKNGWLAKLASIRWWSEASSVKHDLPTSLQEGSGFHFSFSNLQNLLKENGVDILIPPGDFSSNIENYKVDYDEETIVKELFPAYIPQSYVLCEINYVSFNGNIGKCVGFKSKLQRA